MYPVWPVVYIAELLAKLGRTMKDPETCALAFSVYAATKTQLRLADFEPGISERYDIVDRFAIEA